MKPVHTKPGLYLAFSLLFGISYYFVRDFEWSKQILTLWKGAGVGFLAIYAIRQPTRSQATLIAVVMAFGALGDMLIEYRLEAGAVAFLLGHCVAIYLYTNHRRPGVTTGHLGAAILFVGAIAFIAWLIPADRPAASGIAFYSLFLAAMAASAWVSRFSRLYVGIGALLFVISDLLIFSQTGLLQSSSIPHWLIWPLYYGGQLLIIIGVLNSQSRPVENTVANA